MWHTVYGTGDAPSCLHTEVGGCNRRLSFSSDELVIFGGTCNSDNDRYDVFVLNSSTYVWTRLHAKQEKDGPAAAASITCHLIDDETLLVIFGESVKTDGTYFTQSLCTFSFETHEWCPLLPHKSDPLQSSYTYQEIIKVS